MYSLKQTGNACFIWPCCLFFFISRQNNSHIWLNILLFFIALFIWLTSTLAVKYLSFILLVAFCLFSQWVYLFVCMNKPRLTVACTSKKMKYSQSLVYEEKKTKMKFVYLRLQMIWSVGDGVSAMKWAGRYRIKSKQWRRIHISD